jgi:hypothetical protein
MKDDDHLSIQGPPGGPAFPVSITGCGDNGWHGMSLRDYFAAQVMERMISLSVDADGGWHPDTVASGCYVLADAMLRARSAPTAEEEIGQTKLSTIE